MRRTTHVTRAMKPQPSFPARQMLVLALCRICEPIAFMSIFPYIYYMVSDFGIPEHQISFYAGMVTSAFTFAEFATGMLWGRLSDKIGRKPVLLTGLAGTALSVLVFGFAPNIWVALVARALGGLLNGNIGVLQTTVAELVTVKEHQPRAYTIMPLVWCLGSIAGPIIGGNLARPCVNMPSLFSEDSIWNEYPYLLPNLFSAATCVFGVVVGLLFLEETHAGKKDRHDPGLALGRSISQRFARLYKTTDGQTEDETASLLGQSEQTQRYNTTSSAQPLLTSNEDVDVPVLNKRLRPAATEKRRPSAKAAFTKPVIMNIISYGILAFHTMTLDQLFPVFLETSRNDAAPVQLPFKFAQGFGLDQKDLGFILSVQGIYQLFATVILFPFVVQRLGTLNLFRILAAFYFILYFILPYFVLLPDSWRIVGVYFAVFWRCTFSSMAYPSNAILLTNAAPSLETLGTINGVAASTASLCRAFGPTISGILYGLGLTTGYCGLAWWCNGFVAIVGAFVSFQLTEPKGRMDEKINEDEEAATEAATVAAASELQPEMVPGRVSIDMVRRASQVEL
ncbi:major facilitator superfamily domain-containing protein [Coniella lustricola]|uniref:Major facilitator superfamily domain-containing protein n=1 Tax=Coniella lustricola TaxID=2025994 RepID=A0A2T2ZZK8_9PEZI|nr:major facilitator superfamily domain-containing protein [Coniella lustricola]